MNIFTNQLRPFIWKFLFFSLTILVGQTNLSCTKSDSVKPESASEYFIATIDGKVINFDNFVEGQINYKEHGTENDPNIFLVEGNKINGDGVGGMYLFIETPEHIKTGSYQSNTNRPYEAWILVGANAGPPDDQIIATSTKATITGLTDEYAEGTFSGEVYQGFIVNGKKILVTDGKFRVKYKLKGK